MPLPREARKLLIVYVSIKAAITENYASFSAFIYMYNKKLHYKKSICTVRLDEQILSGVKLLRNAAMCAGPIAHASFGSQIAKLGYEIFVLSHFPCDIQGDPKVAQNL